MGELRKDYLMNRWVIIEPERGKRPHEYTEKAVKVKSGIDYFSPDNEKSTPQETYRYPSKGKWQIRAFLNKFPAVKNEGDYNIHYENQFYTFSSNFGYHEVIVETPTKNQLWDFSVKEIENVLTTYDNRINYYTNKEGIKYVCIFKNHGPKAGTSIIHSHSQLVAYNRLPSHVEAKLSHYINGCPHCMIISKEKDSVRKCFENDSFIAFTPYASRFPFEIWIYSKNHETKLNNFKDLATIIRKVLIILKTLNCSYNLELYHASKNTNLHFHIEIQPRLSTWAGFEQFGTIINPVAPEEAAKFYRGGK